MKTETTNTSLPDLGGIGTAFVALRGVTVVFCPQSVGVTGTSVYANSRKDGKDSCQDLIASSTLKKYLCRHLGVLTKGTTRHLVRTLQLSSLDAATSLKRNCRKFNSYFGRLPIDPAAIRHRLIKFYWTLVGRRFKFSGQRSSSTCMWTLTFASLIN